MFRWDKCSAPTSQISLFTGKQNAIESVNMHQVVRVVNNRELDEGQLLRAHRLARLVFEPEVPEDSHGSVPPKHRHMQLDAWREKLSIPHANIVCVTTAAGPAEQTIGDSEAVSSGDVPKAPDQGLTDQMLAIAFNYPRHLDGLESYHIFIAAVHPSARGMGLFSRLREAVKTDARLAGYRTLTISTIPSRFETMFALLSRERSGWEVVKWDDEPTVGDRRVVMKMGLD